MLNSVSHRRTSPGQEAVTSSNISSDRHCGGTGHNHVLTTSVPIPSWNGVGYLDRSPAGRRSSADSPPLTLLHDLTATDSSIGARTNEPIPSAHSFSTAGI